jgi:hypothetical protein
MKKVLFSRLAVIVLLLCISFSKIYAQDNTAVSFAVAPVPQLSMAVVVSMGTTTATTISDVSIYDMDGCLMINQTYGTGVNATLVDYSSLRPDIYVLTVSSDVTSQSQIIGVNYPICPPYCPGL